MGKKIPYTVVDPKTGRLSYRRRYPAELRPFIPAQDGQKSAWELRVTLKDTKFTHAAEARYRAAAQRYEAIEREARQRAAGGGLQLDEGIIQFLTGNYLSAEIEHTNRLRRALPGTEVEDLRHYPARPNLEADWEASRELLSDEDYDVPGIVAMWGDWVQTFARAYGYIVRRQDPAFASLCLEMADTACRLWLAVDPHRSRRPIDDAPSPPKRPTVSDQPQAVAAQTSGKSKTVADLIDAYEAEKSPTWSDSTKSAYAPVKRLLIDAIGDKPVSSLTRDDARPIQNLVKRLPKNLGKQAALKGLKVPDAIKRAEALGLPTNAAQTINAGYIVHIAATFAWAAKEQWTPKNQFYDLEVHDTQEDDQRRDPFQTDQLASIFATDTWTSPDRDDDAAGRYWLPLLGLHQGARLSELAGLRVMDVEEIDKTTWALLIQPHALRRLKNKSSRRNIPVHPTILSLGFGDFVKARKKQAEAAGKPEALLFPGILMKQRGQVGYNIGRWFSELVDDLGLEGRNLSFHSFRHNFEDALRRARIFGTDQGSYLSGRSSRMPNSGKTYGDGWKTMVAELKTEMEMVTYPGLDLAAVKPWKAPGGS